MFLHKIARYKTIFNFGSILSANKIYLYSAYYKSTQFYNQTGIFCHPAGAAEAINLFVIPVKTGIKELSLYKSLF